MTEDTRYSSSFEPWSSALNSFKTLRVNRTCRAASLPLLFCKFNAQKEYLE
jgi:hypothetical protein